MAGSAIATKRRGTASLMVIAVSASFGVALWVALWLPSYGDAVPMHGPLSSEFAGRESLSCPPLGEPPFTFSSPIGEVTYARLPCEKGRSRRRMLLAAGEAVAVVGITVGVVILLSERQRDRS